MQQSPLDVEKLGRKVVDDIAPNEAQYFDVAVTQFRMDPKRPPSSATIDDRLGFGVEIGVALSPIILWLCQLAIDAARKQLQGEVEEAAKSWVSRTIQQLKMLFGSKRRNTKRAADPLLFNLTPAEIRHVRQLVKTKAIEVTKLPPSQAQQIADAIAGSLIETA